MPASCGPMGWRKSTRRVAGTGSPAAASAARAKSLRRVILAADGALCASPMAAAARFRDLHGAVVRGNDPRDGAVAMRGDDPLDDRLAVRELDPEPVPDTGDERVFPLARNEHLDAEIASRLQVGVDPVAAGRGQQQDPGRRVLRSACTRRRPQPQPPPPPPAMPHAPQVPAPPVAWKTLLNTKVEPVSRVTKSISTPRR